jgi:hypothetical protein
MKLAVSWVVTLCSLKTPEVSVEHITYIFNAEEEAKQEERNHPSSETSGVFRTTWSLL